MADPRAATRLAAVLAFGLTFGPALSGCALAPRQAPADSSIAPAQVAPTPVMAATPVPRPPARGASPARPVPAPATEAPAPASGGAGAASISTDAAAALAAPAPELGEALPDAISRALTQGAAPGAVLDASWRNGPARFTLGDEIQAIRAVQLPMAEGVRPPGPLEVLAEPLLVIQPGGLSPTPDRSASPSERMEPGVIVFAMGLTAERDWAVIARGGVMVGYVPAEILAPLSATGPVAAVPPRTDPAATITPVPAATRCRAITIARGQAVETAEACLHPDGAWRILPQAN